MDDKDFQDMLKKYIEQDQKDHAVFYQLLLKISKEIELLKMKSSIWGLMGASIPTLITVAMLLLKSK